MYIFGSSIQMLYGRISPSVLKENPFSNTQLYVHISEFKAKILSNVEYNYKDCKKILSVLLFCCQLLLHSRDTVRKETILSLLTYIADGFARRGKKEYDHNTDIFVVLNIFSHQILKADCLHFSMCRNPLSERGLLNLSCC